MPIDIDRTVRGEAENVNQYLLTHDIRCRRGRRRSQAPRPHFYRGFSIHSSAVISLPILPPHLAQTP